MISGSCTTVRCEMSTVARPHEPMAKIVVMSIRERVHMMMVDVGQHSSKGQEFLWHFVEQLACTA